MPKNDPIGPKVGIFVHCRLIWCPVGWLASGCSARAVSRKTYFYFIGITATGKIKDEGFKLVGKNQQGYTKS